MDVATPIQSSGTKATLLSGTAFIRPTSLERSMGRLMRGPEGHEGGSPAPTPAPSPTPTPAASGGEGEGGGAGEGDGGDTSALGGAGGDVVTKTPEEIAAETKTAEEAAAAAKAAEVPEAYELTAPEGLTLDADMVTEATPVFKELGLSNEQASKLMPVAAKFAERIAEQLNAQIASQVAADRKAWLDTSKADPEIGGKNWDKSLVEGARALDALGFPKGSPFRALLDSSGLGNHAEMIRAWAKVGKAIGEDGTFVRSDQGNGAQKSHAQVLYGKPGS